MAEEILQFDLYNYGISMSEEILQFDLDNYGTLPTRLLLSARLFSALSDLRFFSFFSMMGLLGLTALDLLDLFDSTVGMLDCSSSRFSSSSATIILAILPVDALLRTLRWANVAPTVLSRSFRARRSITGYFGASSILVYVRPLAEPARDYERTIN